MDPYLGVTPGGRSVETRTQASDWDDASVSGAHCNHSRPTFAAINHLPRSDDGLLGGTDNLRSGSALYRSFGTGAPLRERQHHPHLDRQPGHEPDPGPGDVLTPVIGYGARKQSIKRKQPSPRGRLITGCASRWYGRRHDLDRELKNRCRGIRFGQGHKRAHGRNREYGAEAFAAEAFIGRLCHTQMRQGTRGTARSRLRARSAFGKWRASPGSAGASVIRMHLEAG